MKKTFNIVAWIICDTCEQAVIEEVKDEKDI